MKKKLLAAVLAAAMVASTGCVVMAADGDTDYDVENREYKDVTITLEIIAETKEVRGDIENYDSATHMINTVRQALQGIAMGNSSDEVGKTITDLIAEYE